MIRRLVAGLIATAALFAGLATVAPAPTATAASGWSTQKCTPTQFAGAKICIQFNSQGILRGRLVNKSGREVTGTGRFVARNNGVKPLVCGRNVTTDPGRVSQCKRGPVSNAWRLTYTSQGVTTRTPYVVV